MENGKRIRLGFKGVKYDERRKYQAEKGEKKKNGSEYKGRKTKKTIKLREPCKYCGFIEHFGGEYPSIGNV